MFQFPTISRATTWHFLVVLTVCSFCWSERLNSIGIVLLTAHWLFDKNIIEKIKRFTFTIPLVMCWAYFFYLSLATLWSQHTDAAWHSIEVKLGFLILPFLFSTEHYLDTKKRHELFRYFCISLCFSFLYSLAFSYIRYSNLGFWVVFNRMSLSEGIMHCGYYSNYFAYALTWCTFELLEDRRLESRYKKLYLFFSCYFLIILMFLISKTAFLYLGVLLVYLIWRASSFISNKIARILSFVLGFVIIISILTFVPTIHSRIVDTVSNTKTYDQTVSFSNSTGARIVAYGIEWSLIKKRWILGYGNGEANALLLEQFNKQGYKDLAANNMHTHNQVFHTWLDLGLLGVLLLFGFLCATGFQFFQEHHKMGSWMVLLIFFNILTDDMLEIQAGSVFFIFFLCLFLSQPTKRLVQYR